ncbi:hypothetical protein HUJ04_006948 [Dendroctonus ponderosae]|nr:hypothetical protein HUJ04_006948 [Dendroctonus ponderosae]
MSDEIRERIQSVGRCLCALKDILESKFVTSETKIKTYQTMIRPVVMYGYKTWTLTKLWKTETDGSNLLPQPRPTRGCSATDSARKSPQEEYTLYSNSTPDTYDINIIQAYVLTSHHTDEEVDRFYDDIRAISRHHYPVTGTHRRRKSPVHMDGFQQCITSKLDATEEEDNINVLTKTITTALLQSENKYCLGTKTESNLSEGTTRKLQQRRDVTSDKPTTDEELRHFNR